MSARNEQPPVNHDLDSAMAALRGSLPAASGECELCGRWSTDCIDGIGFCCRHRYALDDALPRYGAPAKLRFDYNEAQFQQLLHLASMVIRLDELGVVAVRVETGRDTPTIQTLQALPKPHGAGRHLFMRPADNGLLVPMQKWMRCAWHSVLIEWRVHE